MADLACRLVDRSPDAVLFRRENAAISADMFLRDCCDFAATLPGGGHMINLCRDRYAFAVAFGASLLRRHPCLLTGERSDVALTVLSEAFEDSYIAIDVVDPLAQGTAGLPVYAVIPDDRSAQASTSPVNPVIPAEQLVAVVFTSGSTGTPSPHRKHWGALVQRSRAAAERFGLYTAEACTVVGTVPPQHMYGFETTVLLPLHAPTSSWCGAAFYPTDIQAALAAVPEPRILVTSPLQIRGLLRAEIELPPLRAAISATAPLEAELATAAEARWQTQMLEIFGATEVGSIASRRTIEGDRWTLYPDVSLTEHNDAASVTAPFTVPTVLADEVETLGPRQFRLIGRRTDIVKLGGHRASLSGLNRVLAGLEGVTDSAFLVPDDLDHQPTARLIAVVVAPHRTADSILHELRGRLDPLFLPRRVLRVATLPRNPLGKLPREALLRMVAHETLSTAGET